MNCPRCVKELAHAQQVCGECGFSLLDQDGQFGADAVCLTRVTNAQERLTAAELKKIEAALDAFERAFPQLFMGVYLAALPNISSLRQFAFWLLNRAAIASLEITRPNENGCLLVVDLTTGHVAMVVGYLLECYFTEAELAALLEKGRAAWTKDRVAEGVLQVINAFTKALRHKSRQAQQDPAKFRPTPPAEPVRPEFQRLHQPPDGEVAEPVSEQETP